MLDIDKKLTDEEYEFFKDLERRGTDAFSDDEEALRKMYNNIHSLKALVANQATDKGRKYALSKALNDNVFGFNNPIFKDEKHPHDFWSYKYQDDYTPPDIEKTIEKAKKDSYENFWNWDSDQHWSKLNTNELKEQANRAGYSKNLPAYLDKVREIQTDRDREKVYDDESHKGFWNGGWAIPLPSTVTKLAYPRASEAVLRGDDIKPSDVVLDAAEQALYTFNPGGRAAALLADGARAGKAAKVGAYLADVATNPLVMETLDAANYDDPNNARSEFNKADVAMGAGINAGVGRIINKLNLKRGNRNYINSDEYNKDMKIIDDLKDEYKLFEQYGDQFGMDILNRKTLDKLGEVVNKMKKPSFKSNLTDKYLRSLLLKDAANDAASLISNKGGDAILEDPKLSRRLISGAARGIPVMPQIVGDLVSDYYKLKDKNVEQEKIDRDINALKLLGK